MIKSICKHRRRLSAAALLLLTASWTAGHLMAATCTGTALGEKALFWGDLHAHTAYSLDAYAFGALATPVDAYRFARGASLTLDSGETVRIDRPLDFAAVTDHAETFDLMYACTDPMRSDDPYCADFRKHRENRNPRTLFNDYLLPIVGMSPSNPPVVCERMDCQANRTSQWQRVQQAANEANEPCAFTALIGYEWTASPGGRHWHRNVIYRSDKVPSQTFDYVRFPEVGQLWQALAQSCDPEDGCDVLTIPHNINWADGGTFDLTTDTSETLQLRQRFERLAEIHQEKGSSECLSEQSGTQTEDCGFELVTQNTAKLRMSGRAEDPAAAWKQARSSYYRSLLAQGLALAQGSPHGNPLMLGATGSTDTHFGTPGMVAESSFFGGIAMLWQKESARLTNPAFNPGGLVAVWAEENTRADIFDALQRREAYATSGPRIQLKFGVGDICADPNGQLTVAMGGIFALASSPTFSIMVARDQAPLAAVDLVKGTHVNGKLEETVTRVASFADGRDSLCLTWTDKSFDTTAPAYWYVRVLEAPSPRWSKLLCERLHNCADHPEADRMIQERAWSSPIWYSGIRQSSGADTAP